MKSFQVFRMLAWIAIAIAISVTSFHLLGPASPEFEAGASSFEPIDTAGGISTPGTFRKRPDRAIARDEPASRIGKQSEPPDQARFFSVRPQTVTTD